MAHRAEHTAPPPVPKAPKSYIHQRPSGTAKLVGRGEDTSKTHRQLLRDRPFPYTNPSRVAYANASGDLERNILPRLSSILGGLAPRLHPGLARLAGAPSSIRGYAYRGRNDIYLTPPSYLGSPEITRDIALHETAHTRQSPRPAPKAQIEGGADFLAATLAEALKLPEYQPSYPAYYRRYRQMPLSRAITTALLR